MQTQMSPYAASTHRAPQEDYHLLVGKPTFDQLLTQSNFSLEMRCPLTQQTFQECLRPNMYLPYVLAAVKKEGEDKLTFCEGRTLYAHIMQQKALIFPNTNVDCEEIHFFALHKADDSQNLQANCIGTLDDISQKSWVHTFMIACADEYKDIVLEARFKVLLHYANLNQYDKASDWFNWIHCNFASDSTVRRLSTHLYNPNISGEALKTHISTIQAALTRRKIINVASTVFAVGAGALLMFAIPDKYELAESIVQLTSALGATLPIYCSKEKPLSKTQQFIFKACIGATLFDAGAHFVHVLNHDGRDIFKAVSTICSFAISSVALVRDYIRSRTVTRYIVPEKIDLLHT